MDKELKAKWLEGLRSGEYQQHHDGTLYSRISDRYCCLGVLAEVGGLSLHTNGKPLSTGHLSDHYDVLSEDDQRTLWRMNDGFEGGKQSTFAEIADYIEKNL